MLTDFLEKFHSKCEAFMWSETTGKHKNLDHGFRTNWLLINVKAKGILIFSQNICKNIIAGSCICTAFEFCRHHLSIFVHFFRGRRYLTQNERKILTAIVSSPPSDLIYCLCFSELCTSACGLMVSLHVHNNASVLTMWGTASNKFCFSPLTSYLNNNHIRVINKRRDGMGWRALLLLGEL